jgi:TetR/AcrR family tetracycline transcriptional repressor
MQRTSAPVRAPAPRKRRGRPPRWSRDEIVEAVATMLLAEPAEPLTIARAADAVGAKPMSLYRHFRDRDDLVAAVARHLLVDALAPVDPDAPWQDQVRTWMLSVHEQARRVPRLVQMMARGESADWLVGSARLAAIFERCGVDDDRLIAEAIYWVATITMGHVMIDAAAPRQLQRDRVQASLDRLDAADAARVTGLVPHFARMRDDGFERVAEGVIGQLEHMLASADRFAGRGS